MSQNNHEETRQRRILHELQQFVLNRKTTDVRCELYAHMILNAIHDHASTVGTLDYPLLTSEIEKDYHLSGIPKIHMDEALEKLVAEKQVLRNGQLLSLSHNKLNEMKKNADRSKELETRITDELKKQLSINIPTLSKSQIDSIVQNFYVLLGATFANYGSEAANIFSGESGDITELKKYPEFQEIYKQKILQIVSKDIHSELDRVFNNFFFNPSEELSKFFFTMAQSYVYLQILNVDPELKSLQKLAWSKKRIYIDTNVLINLLFSVNPLYETTVILINQTKQLGASLFVTQRTVDEFLRVLSSMKQHNSNFKFKSKFASAFNEAKNDNPFLTTYAEELRKNSKLTIDVFSKKYEEFDKFIETNYSINVEPIDESIQEEVKADPHRLGVHVIHRAMHKHDDVMAHDVYNICKVRKLRKEEPNDEIGPCAWLLTTDYTLIRAERDTFGNKHTPASISAEIWLQIISPFISPNISIKDKSIAFTKLLSSKFTSRKITVNELSNLLTVFMDDSKFTVEQLKMIIGNDFIKEKLHDVQDLIDKGEEVKLEQFQPIMNKGLELIEAEYKKQLQSSDKSHEKELRLMKENLEELTNEVNSLTSSKKSLEEKENRLEEKVKLREKNWKVRTIIVVISAIVDIALTLWFGTISIIPVYTKIIILTALIGLEIAVFYRLPKLMGLHMQQKNPTHEPWTRSDKISLVSMILTGGGIPTAIILAIYLK